MSTLESWLTEVLGLAIRLAIATLFAIPTFIFGIVAMSLLPKHHPFRVWVEDPLWVEMFHGTHGSCLF